MRVRRFYYVGTESARGMVHRSETKIKGDLTFCGRPVRLGWRWWLGSRNVPKGRKFCEKCV